MILKFSYGSQIFSFLASAISVIVATNKPETPEWKIQKIINNIPKNYKEIITYIEKHKQTIGKVIKEIQDKGGSSRANSVWSQGEGSGKTQFRTILKKMNIESLIDKAQIKLNEEAISIYNEQKYDIHINISINENVIKQCSSWNKNSFSDVFLKYYVWCTKKSPFTSQ